MKATGRRVACRLAAVMVGISAAAACATAPSSPDPATEPPLVLPADVDDQRGRFREIFCAVLEERGPTMPDYRSCDEALTRVGVEPDPTGKTVDLGKSSRRLVAALVPGIG